MSLHSKAPESIELLMSFLRDHQGKEIWFLLVDGFIKGTLDRAPKDPKDEFALINATRYPAKGDKQELDRALLIITQLLGWGGDKADFLDAKG